MLERLIQLKKLVHSNYQGYETLDAGEEALSRVRGLEDYIEELIDLLIAKEDNKDE